MMTEFSSYPVHLALEHIEGHEGYRTYAYKCPAGVWTIGYGHTKGVKEGDGPIAQYEAESLLLEDLDGCKKELAPHIKVPVSKFQFIALVSLAYNLGVPKMVSACPRLMRKLNAGDYDGAADEFLDIVKAGGKVLPGLVRRREEESTMMRMYA